MVDRLLEEAAANGPAIRIAEERRAGALSIDGLLICKS
jgi:hypothetical protein